MNGNMPRPSVAIVVTAVWGTLIFPGLVGAAFSLMFFDAPGSMSDPSALWSAAIVISFPCLCMLSIAGSWVVWLWHRRRPTRFSSYAQIATGCLPLIPVIYVAAAIVVQMAGAITSGEPLGLHSTIIQPSRSSPSPRPLQTQRGLRK